MKQNPIVSEVLTELEKIQRLPVEGVVVYRVLNHLIESKLKNDQKLFHGDNVLFVAAVNVVKEGQNEKVLRVAHAVNENGKLRPWQEPFFVRILCSEKVPDFLKRIQRAINVNSDDFDKFYVILGLPDIRCSNHAALHGEGFMSEVLIAQRGVSNPYVFIIHPLEARETSAKLKVPFLKRRH
jgi:hypothetical protein